MDEDKPVPPPEGQPLCATAAMTAAGLDAICEIFFCQVTQIQVGGGSELAVQSSPRTSLYFFLF
jgi:hypothetical protein